MTVTRGKDNIPAENGNPSTWAEYHRSAHLYEETIKWESRYLCGPRLAAELSGAAKAAISNKKRGWLSCRDGVKKLLRCLRDSMLEPALPEIGNRLRSYFQGPSQTPWRAYGGILRATSRRICQDMQGTHSSAEGTEDFEIPGLERRTTSKEISADFLPFVDGTASGSGTQEGDSDLISESAAREEQTAAGTEGAAETEEADTAEAEYQWTEEYRWCYWWWWGYPDRSASPWA